MKKISRVSLRLSWWTLVIASVANGGFFDGVANNYSTLCSADGLGCDCSASDGQNVMCNGKDIAEIPNGVVFPKKVEFVSFNRNKLDTITNTIFKGGPSVKNIDLSYNSIKFLSGESFQKLESLESLDLSHNELWNLNLNNFIGLTKLKSINLSYNKISSFFPDVFKPLESLRELNFRYNPMLYIDAGSFFYLPNLEELNLESTGLSSLPDNGFTNNTKLKILNVGANAMKIIPTSALASAPQLEKLDISQNQIETLPKESFKGLQNMKVLMLNHMRSLKKIEGLAFKGLPSLRELYVTDNLELTTISEKAFAPPWELYTDSLYEKRSLQKVIFRHNSLKTLPRNLLRWDELYELDLSENPWNCDCNMGWIAESELNEKAKKTIVCAMPPQYSNKIVLGMSKSDFVCRYLSPEAIIGLSLLVSLSFMLALGGAAFLLYKKRWCNCILRRADFHRYTRVVNTKERVDLEWDHGAEPLTTSRSRAESDA